MTSDDVESPQPDQNSAPVAPHNELNPDQAVSLRPAAAEPLPPALPAQPEQQAAPVPPAPDVPVPPTNFSEPLPPPEQPGVDAAPSAPESVQPTGSELAWTASEFIAHPKSIVWYMALFGVSAVILAITYLLTRDVITVVVIAICAAIFGYSASRQPRQLQYGLDGNGITIGTKHYPYKDFRSFALVPEGAFSSIDFMPLKRFAPILSIYFDPTQEHLVTELLTQHLPLSVHKRTLVDALMQRIRF